MHDTGAAGPVRVLVTGSREFNARQVVADALNAVRAQFGGRQLVVVHGACPTGADAIASTLVNGVLNRYAVEEPHPADWASEGRAAGPKRNQRMVDLGAEVCLAFFQRGAGNRGTEGCARMARAASIPVIEHWDSAG